MARVIFYEDRCKGCGHCVRACPKKILALSPSKKNEKGFHTPVMLDAEACVGCASCAIMCPDICIEVER